MHVHYKYYIQTGFTACNAPYNSDACPQLQVQGSHLTFEIQTMAKSTFPLARKVKSDQAGNVRIT